MATYQEPGHEMTTVGELLDYLAGHPRDRQVVLYDGYLFSPLNAAGEVMYQQGPASADAAFLAPEQVPEASLVLGRRITDSDTAPADARRAVILGADFTEASR